MTRLYTDIGEINAVGCLKDFGYVYPESIDLLENLYAARLKRGVLRSVLEPDLVKQIRACPNYVVDPVDFAKKILDAAEERNKKAVV